jgi:DNA primase large subunit
MQVITSVNAATRKLKFQHNSVLSMYRVPPQEELTLDEFELLSLDRLQLLRSIETLRTRGFDGPEFSEKINNLERKTLFGRKDLDERLTDELRDQISHFIIRLAFCHTEDLRRWFLNHEVQLFKVRFEKLTTDEQELFTSQNNLFFERVPDDERNRLADKLIGLAGMKDEDLVRNTKFFK